MGKHVDLFIEIMNRLDTAKTSGTLTDVKKIMFGTRDAIIMPGDYPVINVRPINGQRELMAANQQLTDKWESIEIDLITQPLENNNNSGYDATRLKGAFYLFEKLLNVLEKNTSGAIDMSLNNKSVNIGDLTFVVDWSDERIKFTITMSKETAQFTAGGR